MCLSFCCRPSLLNVDDTAFVPEDKREATDSSVWSDTSFDLGPSGKDELDGNPHGDEHQIGLDTDRSFVLYPVGEHLSFPGANPSLIICSTLYQKG